MPDHSISVKQFAEANGLLRQTVFKTLKRLDIEPSKSRGGKQNRGQTMSHITEDDARRVLEALAAGRSYQAERGGEETEFPDAALYDIGVFYLLCLEPEHDPNRFKVGFASNLNERLRQHRCSAPFTQVVKTWPCRRLWEKTAIECVTGGCERLHTEVFRTQSLESVEVKCTQFFAMMPKLAGAQST
jgi:T5orf172 domain